MLGLASVRACAWRMHERGSQHGAGRSAIARRCWSSIRVWPKPAQLRKSLSVGSWCERQVEGGAKMPQHRGVNHALQQKINAAAGALAS